MKRLPTIFVVLCVVLVACVSALTPTPPSVYRPPEARPTVRIPNRVYYTKRCWPACHYGDHPQLPDAFTDEFEEALEAGWTWINQDSAHWSLSEAPGTLRIVSQPCPVPGNLQDAANVLAHEAPDDHFDVISGVTFDPTSESQSATVFIEFEDGSIVSLSRAFWQEGDAPACVGDGVYFDGSSVGCTRVGVPTSAEMVHLMLRRAGRSYIGYLLEEDKWVEVARCTSTATPFKVGLTAAAAAGDPDSPEIPADFDFFTVQERH